MLQAVLWKSWLVRLASDWLALGSGQIYDIALLSFVKFGSLGCSPVTVHTAERNEEHADEDKLQINSL